MSRLWYFLCRLGIDVRLEPTVNRKRTFKDLLALANKTENQEQSKAQTEVIAVESVTAIVKQESTQPKTVQPLVSKPRFKPSSISISDDEHELIVLQPKKSAVVMKWIKESQMKHESKVRHQNVTSNLSKIVTNKKLSIEEKMRRAKLIELEQQQAKAAAAKQEEHAKVNVETNDQSEQENEENAFRSSQHSRHNITDDEEDEEFNGSDADEEELAEEESDEGSASSLPSEEGETRSRTAEDTTPPTQEESQVSSITAQESSEIIVSQDWQNEFMPTEAKIAAPKRVFAMFDRMKQRAMTATSNPTGTQAPTSQSTSQDTIEDDTMDERLNQAGARLAELAKDSMESEYVRPLEPLNVSMTQALRMELGGGVSLEESQDAAKENVTSDEEEESSEEDEIAARKKLVIVDSDDEDDSKDVEEPKRQAASPEQPEVRKTAFVEQEADVEDDEFMNAGGADGDMTEADRILREELAAFIDEDDQALRKMSIDELEQLLEGDDVVRQMYERQMRDADLKTTKSLVKDITTGKILERRKHTNGVAGGATLERDKFGRTEEEEDEANPALRELDDAQDYGVFGDIIAKYNNLRKEINRRKGLRKRRRGEGANLDEINNPQDQTTAEDEDLDWTNEEHLAFGSKVQIAPGEVIETDLEHLEEKIKKREILQRLSRSSHTAILEHKEESVRILQTIKRKSSFAGSSNSSVPAKNPSKLKRDPFMNLLKGWKENQPSQSSQQSTKSNPRPFGFGGRKKSEDGPSAFTKKGKVMQFGNYVKDPSKAK